MCALIVKIRAAVKKKSQSRGGLHRNGGNEAGSETGNETGSGVELVVVV